MKRPKPAKFNVKSVTVNDNEDGSFIITISFNDGSPTSIYMGSYKELHPGGIISYQDKEQE
jgi:hypothetical protein